MLTWLKQLFCIHVARSDYQVDHFSRPGWRQRTWTCSKCGKEWVREYPDPPTPPTGYARGMVQPPRPWPRPPAPPAQPVRRDPPRPTPTPVPRPRDDSSDFGAGLAIGLMAGSVRSADPDITAPGISGKGGEFGGSGASASWGDSGSSSSSASGGSNGGSDSGAGD